MNMHQSELDLTNINNNVEPLFDANDWNEIKLANIAFDYGSVLSLNEDDRIQKSPPLRSIVDCIGNFQPEKSSDHNNHSQFFSQEFDRDTKLLSILKSYDWPGINLRLLNCEIYDDVALIRYINQIINGKSKIVTKNLNNFKPIFLVQELTESYPRGGSLVFRFDKSNGKENHLEMSIFTLDGWLLNEETYKKANLFYPKNVNCDKTKMLMLHRLPTFGYDQTVVFFVELPSVQRDFQYVCNQRSAWLASLHQWLDATRLRAFQMLEENQQQQRQ